MRIRTVAGAAALLVLAGVIATPLGVFGPGNDDDRPVLPPQRRCSGGHEVSVRVTVDPPRNALVRWVIGDDHGEKLLKNQRSWRRDGTVECEGRAEVTAIPSGRSTVACEIYVDGAVAKATLPRASKCELRHTVNG